VYKLVRSIDIEPSKLDRVFCHVQIELKSQWTKGNPYHPLSFIRYPKHISRQRDVAQVSRFFSSFHVMYAKLFAKFVCSGLRDFLK